ncbi:hypothetical protein Ddc_21169 [Ditylenchus destructor]|nr:hypothetical protein Ddc_21169 [Ditylenchus destructor]
METPHPPATVPPLRYKAKWPDAITLAIGGSKACFMGLLSSEQNQRIVPFCLSTAEGVLKDEASSPEKSIFILQSFPFFEIFIFAKYERIGSIERSGQLA